MLDYYNLSPETLAFLEKRIRGGILSDDYIAWGTHLLESGIESDEIITLASCRDLHWEEINKLIPKVYATLDLSPTIETDFSNYHEIQKGNMLLYENGKISATELVSRGIQLWIKSDYEKSLSDWDWIDDEASLIKQGITTSPPKYQIGKSDDEELYRILIADRGLTSRCTGECHGCF